IISARTLSAAGNLVNAAQGSISVSGLFVTGNVNDYDEATISAGDMSCQNLTIGGQFEPPPGSVPETVAQLSTATLTVRGDVSNSGSVIATGFNFGTNNSGTHNLSGAGQWQFGNLNFSATTLIANDMTFDGGSVRITQG